MVSPLDSSIRSFMPYLRDNATLVKELAPAAKKLLEAIARGGDEFKQLSALMSKDVEKLGLPDPVLSMAKSALEGMNYMLTTDRGGLEKLLADMSGLPTVRSPIGVSGEVAIPGLAESQRQWNLSNTPTGLGYSGYGENGLASTGAQVLDALGFPTAASVVGNVGRTFTSSDMPPPPLTGKDALDQGKQNQYQADLFAYQQRLQNMRAYWEMISTIQKGNDDVRKSIVGNMRT